MTAKHIVTPAKISAETRAKDKFSLIDQQIQTLKEKRERLHIHQALSFTKEAEKILKEDFSPELALAILEKTWNAAPDPQKQEWQKTAYSFRSPIQASEKKVHIRYEKPEQINLPEDDSHALS